MFAKPVIITSPHYNSLQLAHTAIRIESTCADHNLPIGENLEMDCALDETIITSDYQVKWTKVRFLA